MKMLTVSPRKEGGRGERSAPESKSKSSEREKGKEEGRSTRIVPMTE